MCLVSTTNELIPIEGFTGQVRLKEVMLRTTATLYMDPATGVRYHLVFPQSLYVDDELDGARARIGNPFGYTQYHVKLPSTSASTGKVGRPYYPKNMMTS